MYQSIAPWHAPYKVDREDVLPDSKYEKPGNSGLSSAKAARGVAEDMLTKALDAADLNEAKMYTRLGMELIQDMKYFLAVAANETATQDAYTSAGTVMRAAMPTRATSYSDERLHPYTPFQMSTPDSNDWTRKRKGGWWLRRGLRMDAMRYWYQFSDFSRFPGLVYFSNIPDMLCKLLGEFGEAKARMREYNQKTLVESAGFWLLAVHQLLEDTKGARATP